MVKNEIIHYLDMISLTEALWWFIENVTDKTPSRNEVFFYLRERVRAGK